MLRQNLPPEVVGYFLEEAALMAQLRHPNVVSLIGVCTTGSPCTLVLQYCEHGSLLNFLRRHTGFNELLFTSKICIMEDVACGMHFLSSLNIVHRDLSARNILVGADFVCKVGKKKTAWF